MELNVALFQADVVTSSWESNQFLVNGRVRYNTQLWLILDIDYAIKIGKWLATWADCSRCQFDLWDVECGWWYPRVQMRVLSGKPVYLCLLYWPGNTTVSWESHDNCDIDLLVSATTTLQSNITSMLLMIQQMKWFKWNMSPTRLRDSIFPNCSPYLTFIGPNER